MTNGKKKVQETSKPETEIPVLEDPDDPFESNPPTPPDGGWGWWVVFASFMIHVIGKLNIML